MRLWLAQRGWMVATVVGLLGCGSSNTATSSATGGAATGGNVGTGAGPATSSGLGGNIEDGTLSSGGLGSGQPSGSTGASPSSAGTGGNSPDTDGGTGGNAPDGGTGNNLSMGGAGTGGNAPDGGTGNKPSTGGAGTGGNSPDGGTGNDSSTGGAATGGDSPDGGTGNDSSTGGSSGTGGSADVNCGGQGWTLVWSDEFDGPAGSAVDSGTWTFDIGTGSNGWGNQELQYYTDRTENIAMDGDGHLVITARQESMQGSNYTSSRIKTLGQRTFQFGRIEGRLKIPRGQGLWPAFWMLGEDFQSAGWPNCGEIDIMENVGSEPDVIHGTLHGPGYSGGSGVGASATLSGPVADDFHVFAVEWEENTITWYVDDQKYSTKTSNDVPGTWVYNHEFFIILNVAVGGQWPGSPNGSTVFPQEMVVDYIRHCEK